MTIFDFLDIKREILDVLSKQTEDGGRLVQDIKYAEGTVRSRKDGDYRKQGGKWVKVYSGTGRGASLAVTHAVKKIKAAKNVDELMDLVNSNISRFYDKNGKLLPVVQRLKEAVNESKTRINSAKKENETLIDIKKDIEIFGKNATEETKNAFREYAKKWEDSKKQEIKARVDMYAALMDLSAIRFKRLDDKTAKTTFLKKIAEYKELKQKTNELADSLSVLRKKMIAESENRNAIEEYNNIYNHEKLYISEKIKDGTVKRQLTSKTNKQLNDFIKGLEQYKYKDIKAMTPEEAAGIISKKELLLPLAKKELAKREATPAETPTQKPKSRFPIRTPEERAEIARKEALKEYEDKERKRIKSIQNAVDYVKKNYGVDIPDSIITENGRRGFSVKTDSKTLTKQQQMDISRALEEMRVKGILGEHAYNGGLGTFYAFPKKAPIPYAEKTGIDK